MTPTVPSIALAALALLATASARAELISLDIRARAPFAQGKPFEATGPYEKLVGVAKFAVDPKLAANRAIVDLELAPRNARGMVEFASDIYILTPKDPARGNGAIFYDVNNRGTKLALKFFNRAPGGNDLDKPGSEGDGFLMRRGYTVVWCGWIGELLPGEGRMLLNPPVAQVNGAPVRGPVRFEMSTDKAVPSMPLSRRPGHGSYAPTSTGLAAAKLTVRGHETDPRKEVPHGKWKVTQQPLSAARDGVPQTLKEVRLEIEGGFVPGLLYELVCECEGSLVQGTGFAATRDLISFLRYDESARNPIRRSDGKPVLKRALAFGVSQSGRFLRHLLWQGFNVDEKGRPVFDGLMPHVAGGGLGFFNHRFAQPTRHNGQHEDHLYPADIFPFTYGASEDPFSNRRDGILLLPEKNKVLPKLMHTQSAAEYWHRSGSLVHTDPLGRSDAEIPANVRVYAFGGTQHGPANDPPTRTITDNLVNPGDYRPQLRALLDALDAWVVTGTLPPPSVYPRIDQKTLVDWRQESTGFPKIPDVRYPGVIQQPVFADYGSEFYTKWIISREPPEVKARYTVLVSKSGPDGNDLGTLLPAEVAVPLATYTGWNLRRSEFGADGQLANLLGSYIPFAKTKAERLEKGDPRASLEERYGNFASYRAKFDANCQAMVRTHYLLAEDAQRLLAERDKLSAEFAK